MKQEALQLEPVLGSYGACKFPIHFLWRSRLTTVLFEVTELTHVRDALVVKPRQCIISNNTFSSLMVNCSLQDSFKGT